MKINTIIILSNGQIVDVKETFDELGAKINDNNKFISVTKINSYIIGHIMQKHNEKTILLNINHIATIEPT